MPTTESSDPSAGDQLTSLPTFQTSTLRGPASCATPTPRGILTRPSPRSAVPTPLALQNIEGERRRMFVSASGKKEMPSNLNPAITKTELHYLNYKALGFLFFYRNYFLPWYGTDF